MDRFKNISETDANKLLFDVIENKEVVTQEHILLAVSKRSFVFATQLLLLISDIESVSADLDSTICNIMQSPIDLTTQFYLFSAALAVKNVHLPHFISSLSFVSAENSMYAIPIITYHSISYSDAPESITGPLSSFYKIFAKEKDTGSVLDYIFTTIINDMINEVSPKLEEFNSCMSVLEDFYVTRRVHELTNAVGSYIKRIENTMFMHVFNDHLNYIVDTIVKNFDKAASITASLELIKGNIPSIVHAYQTVFSFCENDIEAKSLEYVNNSIAFRYSNRLQQTMHHSIVLCYLVAIGRQKDSDDLIEKMRESVKNVEENFPGDNLLYSKYINDPLNRYAKITDKSSEISKNISDACDMMSTIVATGECMLLEAVLRDEAAMFAKGNKLYPMSYSNVLHEFNNSLEEYHNAVAQKRDFLEKLNNLASDFLGKVKTAPGARINIDLSRAKMPKGFKLPKIDIKSPKTAVEVHLMLFERLDIIESALTMIDLADAPMCMYKEKPCKLCAEFVCKKCKKLVLCHKHCKDGTPCPICGTPINVL